MTHATRPARVDRLALGLPDLTPGDGLTPTAAGYHVAAPHVRFASAATLAPGWYEVRVAAASHDRFAVRKRLELTFDSDDAAARPPAREAFAWNQSFAERFVLKLTRPAAGVRLDVRHAEGPFSLREFAVTRLSQRRVVARAVREKVRLTFAYRCFGGALKRGVKMLAAGRFREFAGKLFKGLTDSRGMQLGKVTIGEADGSWRRRNALPADRAEAVRAAVDALPDPTPLAVLLPVEGTKLDPARLSAHSVRRQLYPHWHLVIAASAGADLDPHLRQLVPDDARVTVVRVPRGAGLSGALAAGVAACPCGGCWCCRRASNSPTTRSTNSPGPPPRTRARTSWPGRSPSASRPRGAGARGRPCGWPARNTLPRRPRPS